MLRTPRPAPTDKRAQLTYKETRELEELPARIEALEREQNDLARRLSDPALYQDRSVDLRALNARHAENAAELDRLLVRWEALETKKGSRRG